MAEVEWLHLPERGGECGLTVQGDTRSKPLGPHGQEPKSRSRDQVRCAEPDGGAWNATIGARVLRRMSFSARFAASANYATTPLASANASARTPDETVQINRTYTTFSLSPRPHSELVPSRSSSSESAPSSTPPHPGFFRLERDDVRLLSNCKTPFVFGRILPRLR